MQLKLIFLLSSLLFISSVSCQNSQKKNCTEKQAQYLGLQHASEGLSNQSEDFIKNCPKNKRFPEAYLKGYTEGLIFFCTEARGRSQALYGLPKEAICHESLNYKRGFQAELQQICSRAKATSDASTNLNTTNSLCKTVPVYRKTYFRELNKKCTYRSGKKIGYEKKTIANLCADSKNLKSFLRGHKEGLKKIYGEENRLISKDLRKLRKHRNSLKYKLKKVSKKTLEKQERINLNIDLNKTETTILDLQSLYEKNKRFLLQ